MATVLVVDDAMFMRLAISNMLTDAGFEIVGEAENGKEAIIQYRTLHPDIVTMDVTMPVMSGLEATKEIVNENPNAKIVIVTALGQQKIVMQALENGAKDFITKPFDKERIASTIRHLIE